MGKANSIGRKSGVREKRAAKVGSDVKINNILIATKLRRSNESP
jgi:hypothetical protein